VFSTKDIAEMVRCPVCREGSGDQCNFLPEDSIRPARDCELSYHHERLRRAERTLGKYASQAIRNDIRSHYNDMFKYDTRSHARHLIVSVWELVVATVNRIR
jgi:DICT domain-containing protein